MTFDGIIANRPESINLPGDWFVVAIFGRNGWRRVLFWCGVIGLRCGAIRCLWLLEIIGRKIAGNAVDLEVDEIVFWITFVDNKVDHAVVVA